jgi:hypothetical protein
VADLRRLLADIAPLRESADVRRLWIGTTLSTVGSALTVFAVRLQVFLITGSSAAVGGVGAAGIALAVPAVVRYRTDAAGSDHPVASTMRSTAPSRSTSPVSTTPS